MNAPYRSVGLPSLSRVHLQELVGSRVGVGNAQIGRLNAALIKLYGSGAGFLVIVSRSRSPPGLPKPQPQVGRRIRCVPAVDE